MERRSVWDNAAVRFFLFLVILAGCWFLGRILDFDVSYYQDLLSRYPLALSGAIFVVIYVATSTFLWFGPKDVLRMVSAILFGATISTVLVWIGEMINAPIMFHLSRFLGREYVQRKLGVNAQEIDKMKGDTSFLAAIAWRINPLVPFRFSDLGYGLTRISFRKYFLAIIVVTFFRILWVQFIIAGIGVSVFKDISAMLDYFLAHPLVMRTSMLYFLVVVLMTVIAMAARSFQGKKPTAE